MERAYTDERGVRISQRESIQRFIKGASVKGIDLGMSQERAECCQRDSRFRRHAMHERNIGRVPFKNRDVAKHRNRVHVRGPVILGADKSGDTRRRLALPAFRWRDTEHANILEQPIVVVHLFGNMLRQVLRESGSNGILRETTRRGEGSAHDRDTGPHDGVIAEEIVRVHTGKRWVIP